MVDEAHGDSKATVNTAKAQTILQQYQQYRQTDKPSQPQQTAYSGVKGYDPSQPANSAYNRTILSYNSAGVNYDIISGGKDTAPTTSQAASVFGTTKPDPQLQQAQAKGYQDVQVFDKSGNVIATVPIGQANDKLTGFANQYGEISYKPVNQKSVNPEEEQMVLQSLKENPQMLGKVITAKGSYLNSLVAQGVLTSEDIDKINQISGTYTAQVKAANAKTRQENIQASFKEQADITTNLQSAQKAGVTSVNIVDASGKVIGTVNPQNIGQARLQTLKLVSRSGGVGLQYNITTNTQAPGVETRVTTYQPSNPLTAFTGGALGGFAELGLIGVGLVAKLTGKSITIPGTGYTAHPTGVLQQAQEKVQKTFGQDALDKIASGTTLQNPLGGLRNVNLTNPEDLASLAGLGASIIATGGVGAGIKTVEKAPSIISDLLRSSGVVKTLLGKGTQEAELQSVKVLNIKSSTGLFGPEGVQTRGTAKFGSGGVSSTVTDLDSGGVGSSITPKGISTTPTKSTGVFGETKTTGKGTTGVFQGNVKEGITTSTPEFGGKLEYISGTQSGKGSLGGKGGTTSETKPDLSTLEKVKTTKPSELTKSASDVLSSENRQLVKTVSRTDLEKESPRLKQDAFGTITRTRTGGGLISRTKQEEETIYLTTPKSGSKVVPLTKTESRQTQNYKNTLSQLTQPQKEKTTRRDTSTGILYKTTPISTTKPVITTTTKSKQITSQITSSKEKYGTGTPFLGTPQVPESKRFGGFLPGFGTLPGGLGRVSKGGSRKVYTGNVPFESIVGIYKRGETTYGNVKNPKPKKLASNGKNLKFR